LKNGVAFNIELQANLTNDTTATKQSFVKYKEPFFSQRTDNKSYFCNNVFE